ncbi:MAG: S8/S53 family peptidase [Chloroflexi bacterium]|nr:S8/S53 family peptidase [Chloroflexota bacterium]
MQNRSTQGLVFVLILVLAILVWLDAPGWLLLILFLLLLGLVGGLMGEERPSPPTEPPEPSRQEYPPEEFYVQDQVIVSGPAAQVAAAVQAAEAIIRPEPLRRITFGALDADTRICLNDCADGDFADFVINLYQLSGSEAAVAAAIAAINRAVGRGSAVRAEPNWLSGHPWDPTGSPWDPTGSPWDPTGSSGADSQSAPPELFLKQWALQQIELSGARPPGSGRGVRIGVFDTSPYDDRLVMAGSHRALDWVTEPAPLSIQLANYPVPAIDNAQKDLSNHGVFAAGLAHAVAPAADIHLIRVLNRNNKGDLFSLNQALFDFVKANAPGQRPSDIIGAVINLSLGIRVPPDEAGFNLPVGVQSLRDILRAAQCAKIVVVAAAGNDSANLPQPEPANLPANWSPIIGVAGSNYEQGRGCFSNRGDLAAPGGDGRPDPTNPTHFIPANDVCGGQDCPTAVIGPVIKTDSNTGFAYWSGTSFATPLVSGLAALVIERGGGQLSPPEVRQIIECGLTAVTDPHLGKGIINVRQTLDQCAPYQVKAGSSD